MGSKPTLFPTVFQGLTLKTNKRNKLVFMWNQLVLTLTVKTFSHFLSLMELHKHPQSKLPKVMREGRGGATATRSPTGWCVTAVSPAPSRHQVPEAVGSLDWAEVLNHDIDFRTSWTLSSVKLFDTQEVFSSDAMLLLGHSCMICVCGGIKPAPQPWLERRVLLSDNKDSLRRCHAVRRVLFKCNYSVYLGWSCWLQTRICGIWQVGVGWHLTFYGSC